jgi:excisionase family DNA binding protein
MQSRGLLTTEEAATYLGLTPRYFRDNYRTWGIPAVRFGHRTIRFRPDDLESFARKMARR